LARRPRLSSESVPETQWADTLPMLRSMLLSIIACCIIYFLVQLRIGDCGSAFSVDPGDYCCTVNRNTIRVRLETLIMHSIQHYKRSPKDQHPTPHESNPARNQPEPRLRTSQERKSTALPTQAFRFCTALHVSTLATITPAYHLPNSDFASGPTLCFRKLETFPPYLHILHSGT
jgi:hypothetical protein